MMPISTTVGGLENIVLVRLAFHQVATTHAHTKKNADHQKIVCFMTEWEFRHWNVIANGNQSKLQGNEGGGGRREKKEEDAFDLTENRSQTLEILCPNI